MPKHDPASPTPQVSVTVPTLKYVATKSMPPSANDLRAQGQVMQPLLVVNSTEYGAGPNNVFGTVVPGSTSLGNQYNALANAISALATKFGSTVQASANNLNTIADNYRTTDNSIAGR
jgi:hypothetical protein